MRNHSAGIFFPYTAMIQACTHLFLGNESP